MFRGRYEHTIDAKGRTSIPVRYREGLAIEGGLVLTSGLDPCLHGYAPGVWNALEQRIAALPQFDPAVVKLKRVYLSGAVLCDIDASGRVLIPSTLREYAGLRKEVLWAGGGHYAELWDKRAWSRALELDVEERQAIATRLVELGL